MKHADVVAGVLLALGFGAALWEATSFQYRTEFAPGPGFAPVWISAIAIVIALLIASNAFREGRRAKADENSAPAEPIERRGLARVGATLAGLVAMLALVPFIGFVPAMFAFLVFLTLLVQRLPFATGLAVSAGTVVFVYVVFVHFLDVPIPRGPLGF
jgi:hypothetical protein